MTATSLVFERRKSSLCTCWWYTSRHVLHLTHCFSDLMLRTVLMSACCGNGTDNGAGPSFSALQTDDVAALEVGAVLRSDSSQYHHHIQLQQYMCRYIWSQCKHRGRMQLIMFGVVDILYPSSQTLFLLERDAN